MRKKHTILWTLLMILFIGFGSQKGISQSTQREIGLRLTNFDSFGFIYKKKRKENKFFRVRLLYGKVQVESVTKIWSADCGFAIGFEKRKQLTEKLSFIHGFEPRLQFDFRERVGSIDIRINPALGYVIGFTLKIKHDIFIGIETIPAISLILSDFSGGFELYADAKFESNNIALTATYFFEYDGKKKNK